MTLSSSIRCPSIENMRMLGMLLETLAIMLFNTTVVAAPAAADLMKVQDAYIRAVPPGQPNGAAYMVLHNTGAADQDLVTAISPIAKALELHTSSYTPAAGAVMQQMGAWGVPTSPVGMMTMRKLDKITIPAGTSVTLQPGGLHIMLIGLQEQVSPGMLVPITLGYADGTQQRLTAEVRELGAVMSGHGEHSNHHNHDHHDTHEHHGH